MTISASNFPKNYRCKGADVVVAGAIGGKIGVLACFLPKGVFCNSGFGCYNCYNSLFNRRKVRIVKGLRLLQASKNGRSLLQVVTSLLQSVTIVCYKVVTVAKYWFSIACGGCNKCYKCNNKKLADRKNTF